MLDELDSRLNNVEESLKEQKNISKFRKFFTRSEFRDNNFQKFEKVWRFAEMFAKFYEKLFNFPKPKKIFMFQS